LSSRLCCFRKAFMVSFRLCCIVRDLFCRI